MSFLSQISQWLEYLPGDKFIDKLQELGQREDFHFGPSKV